MSKFCSLFTAIILTHAIWETVLGDASFNRVDGKDGAGKGPRIHWKKPQVDFELAYGSFPASLRPTIISAVVQSLNAWSLVDNTTVEYNFTGCASFGADANDGINTVVYIDKLWPAESTALAITKTYFITDPHYNTGAIIDADVLVNGQHHTFGFNNGSKYDVQSVITHELGHALGLGHEVNPINISATMYSRINTGEINKRALANNDKGAIQFLYPSTINKTKRAASEKCKGDVLKYTELKEINDGGCSVGSIYKDGNGPKNPMIDLGFLSLLVLFFFKSRKKFTA